MRVAETSTDPRGAVSRPPPPPAAASRPAADPRIEAARGGDKRAFEALYREHVGGVNGLCLRLCGGDARRAEELTQRTFIKAWQGLPRFRAQAAFGTWLHRIAVRVILDHERTPWWRRRQAQVPERVASAPEPGRRVDLQRAVDTLPPKARRVLVLHDIEGWRHQDIAEALKISVGTSKSQLHRARKLLRERLS